MRVEHQSVVFCTVDNFPCPDQVWIHSCDLQVVSLGAPVGVDSKTLDGLRVVPGIDMWKHHPSPFANWGRAVRPQKHSLQAIFLSLCLYLEMLLELKSKHWSFTRAGLKIHRGAGACSAAP